MVNVAASIAALVLLSSTPILQNGDFRSSAGGLANGWSQIGRYTRIATGGRNGAPAVELTCDGTGQNAALQVIHFDQPRTGPFTVTAWARGEDVGEGGDCALWLDVMQKDAPAIWGQRATPDRAVNGWQKLAVEVYPAKPVTEIQVYLIIRNVRGRVRFCDVRMMDGALPPDPAPPRPEPAGVKWWVADSMTRVFRDGLAPVHPPHRIQLDMARAERESFQVCLMAGREPLEDVRVGVPELVSGSHRLPASCVTWSRVGYVWVETPFQHPAADRRRGGTWWPDPLLAPVPFSVDVDQVQPVWFTVHVPDGTPPGTYAGKITLRPAGGTAIEVPVKVVVHPVTLPVTGQMKTAFALMDYHLRKLYGRITPQLRRAYTDIMLDHRLNPDDISRTQPPDLGELTYANTRGLNAFNILNLVPEPKTDSGWVCWSEIKDYTPEFKKHFIERLEAIVPELEKRGLIDKAYVYGFDERGAEYKPVMREFFGEIKKRFPRLHTLSTYYIPGGADPRDLNVDWFCPLSPGYDPKLAAQLRRGGGEMWWYVCCGPTYPYANWLLEYPLIEARLIWWQAFQLDVDGCLYWGVSIWERAHNDKPIPDGAGPRLEWSVTTPGLPTLNGDGVLLYPGEHGPLSSIRLENIRDGIEDNELLRMYRSRFGQAKADTIVKRVTIDRTRFSRNVSDLRAARLAALKGLR